MSDLMPDVKTGLHEVAILFQHMLTPVLRLLAKVTPDLSTSWAHPGAEIHRYTLFLDDGWLILGRGEVLNQP